MPTPAARRRTKGLMSDTRLDQMDAEETIRRAREVRAETRRLIEQARKARQTAASIGGVPARRSR